MKQNSKSTTRVVVYTILILLIGVFLAYGFMYKFPKLFQETITIHTEVVWEERLCSVSLVLLITLQTSQYSILQLNTECHGVKRTKTNK